MKIIKITTDNEISVHDFPKGSIMEQNQQLRAMIGPCCELYEHVMPNRLYTSLGASRRVTGTKGSCTGMLVDEEGILRELDIQNVLREAGMSDTRRQIIGRRSKASGESFEHRLSNACEFYLRNGWAHIEKTPEPFHITGKGADGVVHGYYEKKGQPDYKGILCDGTGIMFEAKHTDSGRINQNVVTDNQWESLDIYEKFGAHCYVMVSIGLVKFYRVPWDTWKQMKKLFGHKFMTEQELEPYRLQERQCMILILEGVELKDENTKGRIGTEN